MEINKQLFEDVLSGKLKGTFVLKNGAQFNDKLLTDIYGSTVVLGKTTFYFNGKPIVSDYNGILDIVDFVSDTDNILAVNTMKPARTLEFKSNHYYFVQRYRHSLCLYHSGATLIVVEFDEEADVSHRYFVVGMSFIDGYHESGWDSDGTEYSVGPCIFKNQTGYAKPVSFDDI